LVARLPWQRPNAGPIITRIGDALTACTEYLGGGSPDEDVLLPFPLPARLLRYPRSGFRRASSEADIGGGPGCLPPTLPVRKIIRCSRCYFGGPALFPAPGVGRGVCIWPAWPTAVDRTNPTAPWPTRNGRRCGRVGPTGAVVGPREQTRRVLPRRAWWCMPSGNARQRRGRRPGGPALAERSAEKNGGRWRGCRGAAGVRIYLGAKPRPEIRTPAPGFRAVAVTSERTPVNIGALSPKVETAAHPPAAPRGCGSDAAFGHDGGPTFVG